MQYSTLTFICISSQLFGLLYLRENVDDFVVVISDFANILLVYQQASEAVQSVLQHSVWKKRFYSLQCAEASL